MDHRKVIAEEASYQALCRINETAGMVSDLDYIQGCLAGLTNQLSYGFDAVSAGFDDRPTVATSFPIAYLEFVARRVTDFIVIQGGATDVFVQCAVRLGLDAAAPELWETWRARDADVRAHGTSAVERLRDAMVDVRAVREVVYHVAPFLPQRFPARTAWNQAAMQLLRHAVDEVTLARGLLERMRPAIVSTFFATRMLLRQYR